MEQSPSREADSHSASIWIPRLLCNPKVHCRFHKSPPLPSILSPMNPVHTFPPFLSKIHFNIILPSLFGFSESSLPFRFPDQNFVFISHISHACYMPHPSVLDLLALITFCEEYKLCSSSLYSPLQPSATSSLLGPSVTNVVWKGKVDSSRVTLANRLLETRCENF